MHCMHESGNEIKIKFNCGVELFYFLIFKKNLLIFMHSHVSCSGSCIYSLLFRKVFREAQIVDAMKPEQEHSPFDINISLLPYRLAFSSTRHLPH